MDNKERDKEKRPGKDRKKGGASSYNEPEIKNLKLSRSDTAEEKGL